jgi:hypothetical protein
MKVMAKALKASSGRTPAALYKEQRDEHMVMSMAVVGAPSYFAKRPRPKTPQDLTSPFAAAPLLASAGARRYTM